MTSPLITPFNSQRKFLSIPKRFQLSEGHIVFEDSADSENSSATASGPIFLCLPGIGDCRGQYRFIFPSLLSISGARVIAVDPRGHGDSANSFKSYLASDIGGDLISLIEALDIQPNRQIIILGNSAGSAAACWFAAERPDFIRSLILLGGFIRDHPMNIFLRGFIKLLFRGPWGTSAWLNFYKTLYVKLPIDYQEYCEFLRGRLNCWEFGDAKAALRANLFASKALVTERLNEIHVPVLTIGGEKDPDFKVPENELDWHLTQLKGEKLLIENAGHYCHIESPELVFEKIQQFLENNPSNITTIRVSNNNNGN